MPALKRPFMRQAMGASAARAEHVRARHATDADLDLVLGLLGLAACSSPEPLIDRINVSDAKYNRDIADCREQISGGGILGIGGGSTADCMKGKGYRVLMGNSGL